MLRFGLSEQVIDDICGVFESFPVIEKVYLFGSRAKGTHKEGSDIDLAIVGENIGTNLLLEIQTKIEALELLYKVDTVVYQPTNTPLMEHIDRVKQVFYERRSK